VEVLVAEELIAVDWMFWYIAWGIIGIIEIMILFVIFWLIKGGLWSLIRYRIRGGSLILAAYPDNSIDFGVLKKPNPIVKFQLQNERGEKEELATNITKIKHHLKGTSKPIHLCIVGHGENVSLLKKFEADKSSAYLNRWGQNLFQEGLSVGRALREEVSGFFRWDSQTLFGIIIICVLIAVAAMQFITLSNMSPPG